MPYKTLLIFLFALTSYGASLDWQNALANAIYKTEGGEKTAHPYGIMTHYTRTTPRQACLNTIKHRLTAWKHQNSSIGFIEFLASTYCPESADPIGHKNWIKNVRYFMKAQGMAENPE